MLFYLNITLTHSSLYLIIHLLGRRVYLKTYNTDLVPLDSAYHTIDLTTKLVHDASTNLWILDGINEILDRIRQEDEDHAQ